MDGEMAEKEKKKMIDICRFINTKKMYFVLFFINCFNILSFPCHAWEKVRTDLEDV